MNIKKFKAWKCIKAVNHAGCTGSGCIRVATAEPPVKLEMDTTTIKNN